MEQGRIVDTISSNLDCLITLQFVLPDWFTPLFILIGPTTEMDKKSYQPKVPVNFLSKMNLR